MNLGITKFSNKVEMEALLDNILLQRDIFKQDVDYDIWKSAFYSIYGISKLISTQLQQKIWEGTEVEQPLKQLQRTTNRFVRKIRRQGKSHGLWNGGSKRCSQILKIYQERCEPQIRLLISNLDKTNPLREDIEEKYPQMLQ